MRNSFRVIRPAIAAAALLAAVAPAQAVQNYATTFAKTDNIYTNLNQQFPVTGTGVPGSGVGTPNASYLFSPPPTGSGNLMNDVNNGINFLLTSDAAGHDFSEVQNGSSLTLPIALGNATAVYLLAGAYNTTLINVTLTGTGGATQTFNGIYLPDFNGGTTNTVAGGVADQTVFQVLDVGAGGSGNSSNEAYNYYGLTEVGLTLGAQFAGQTLTSATITSSGSTALILGATVVAPAPVGGVPEPATWAMLLAGFGGVGVAARARRFRRSITA